MGRQGQRSGTTTVHHQRQYSDNFLESSSNGRWLQSAGLQHLQSSNASMPPFQVVAQLGFVTVLIRFLLVYGNESS